MGLRWTVWPVATLAGLGVVAYLDHRFSTALPMMHLYYLPILLAGAAMGYVGGLAAAGGAIALFDLTHLLIRGEDLVLDETTIVRFVLFLLVGLIAAKLTGDRRRLAEMARSLQLRNDELVHLNERLERLSEARADFVAVASHEIKTPLTAVIGYAQLLSSPSLGDKPRRDVTGKLDTAARRLHRTAETLLDATLLDSGRLIVQPVPIRLAHLLEECQASAGIGNAERLHIDLPPHLRDRTVLGDRVRLPEVLGNLVSNALKYSGDDRPVVVTAEDRPDGIRIAVSDAGPGIPAQDLPRIFDRYYRASDGRVRANGAGLGLSVSREIVRAHGGQLEVQSEPGRGSTFTVCLPPADLEEPMGETALREDRTSPALTVALRTVG